MSHPIWVRGLKLSRYSRISRKAWSHPIWVRGLKPQSYLNLKDEQGVAPHMGAWIETLCRR